MKHFNQHVRVPINKISKITLPTVSTVSTVPRNPFIPCISRIGSVSRSVSGTPRLEPRLAVAMTDSEAERFWAAATVFQQPDEARKRQANSGPGVYGGKPVVLARAQAVSGRVREPVASRCGWLFDASMEGER